MNDTLKALGLQAVNAGTVGRTIGATQGTTVTSYSPIDGAALAQVVVTTEQEYDQVVKDSQETFREWRMVPAPQRGLIVREMGEEMRAKKRELGALISLECGKILAEGEGEVQEAIDIADFAVGLSRQLYGKTMHSERARHRMYEQWHPLGPVGVITAFNFPMAVWAWNAMLAAVCGDTVIWKPSELTPLCALALNRICREVAERHGFPALFSVVVGDGPQLGQRLAADRRIPLISATGSCRMGRAVAETVGKRLGKSILELGGNNAVIVLDDADIDMAVRSTLFGAVGTAGQRCTSTRRILIQRGVAKEFTDRLAAAYRQVKIGNPLEEGVLMGPLIHEGAVESYRHALEQIRAQGGEVVCGGRVLEGKPSNLYVEPCIVRARHDMPIVREETFAPILYIIEVDDLEQAIAYNNEVPQGLSSAIFTRSVQHAEQFLAAIGSDCGIANVNIGTSGAEIGGAFGGEKDTGGGRESGSDSWKQYMRRQTNTINWSNDLPLAQGIKFDVGSSIAP